MKLTIIYFYLLCIIPLMYGCSGDATGPDQDDTPDDHVGIFTDFRGPTYSDNYLPFNDWSQRSDWNLANVHDPTVIKDGEYFYMYQTNASYGNVHEAGGEYPVRRSRDLVNWEFMGAVFDGPPAWVRDSLNSIRADMDPALPPINNPRYGFGHHI